MAISLDELNATHVPADIFTDRWTFQLAEEFNGPHAGAMFAAGRSVEPVDFRVFRKFVVNYGRSMIGALRVVGEPAALGDCSTLRKAAGVSEPVAVTEEPAQVADEDEEPASGTTPSQRPQAHAQHKGKHR